MTEEGIVINAIAKLELLKKYQRRKENLRKEGKDTTYVEEIIKKIEGQLK